MERTYPHACNSACGHSAVYVHPGQAGNLLSDQIRHRHSLPRLRHVTRARLSSPAGYFGLPAMQSGFGTLCDGNVFLVNRETFLLERLSMRIKDTVIALGFGFTIVVYIVRLAFFNIP